MSFDHDAAGERGVQRQQFVDGLLTEMFVAADGFGDGITNEALAEFHICLTTFLMRGPIKPMLFPDARYAFVTHSAMKEVIDRTKSFTQDEPEYRYILLTLSQKLLASATVKIVSDFCRWESDKFQERYSTKSA